MTLNSIAKRSFALYRKKLDPHKHMFMTKNIENMYESYSWPGRIFEITRAPIRQPAIKTTESVAKVIFDFFKRVAPQNFTFKIEDYDKVRQNSWWVYEVDFDAHNADLKEELKQHCLRLRQGLRWRKRRPEHWAFPTTLKALKLTLSVCTVNVSVAHFRKA